MAKEPGPQLVSVAAVTSIASVRDRKRQQSKDKTERARTRMTEALDRAETPGQIVAAALDYLRVALAAIDPTTAVSTAWEIHNDLISRADELNARR